MRVLLVKHDMATAVSIKMKLDKEHLICNVVDPGDDGFEIARLHDYDIILVDMLSPQVDTYEMLCRLQEVGARTPVLILSDVSELDPKIKALGYGAEDCFTEPFDRCALIARIHSTVHRSKGLSQSIIRTGRLAVNLDTREVLVDDQTVHLTGKEYRILELLTLRKGTTITKEMFLNHLYGGVDEPELKIIDVFVCKLRKKIAQQTGGDHYIETVWGRGYVLRDPGTPSRQPQSLTRRMSVAADVKDRVDEADQKGMKAVEAG